MEQKQKSAFTKQLILDEAFKLFYKNGFKTTSIDKIMAATTLTKGAFYHHFKNKKELGQAVISSILQQRVYDGMITPLYQSGDAFEILQSTFIERIRSFSVYEKAQGCPMNNFINEIGGSELAYKVALKRIIEEWKAALIYLIDKGKVENSIHKNIDSKAVAVYLIAAFEGIRGIRKLYDNDLILEEYLAGVLLFLKQIKA